VQVTATFGSAPTQEPQIFAIINRYFFTRVNLAHGCNDNGCDVSIGQLVEAARRCAGMIEKPHHATKHLDIDAHTQRPTVFWGRVKDETVAAVLRSIFGEARQRDSSKILTKDDSLRDFTSRDDGVRVGLHLLHENEILRLGQAIATVTRIWAAVGGTEYAQHGIATRVSTTLLFAQTGSEVLHER
jgi:hypothetical protein